jgi:hypothetical protein
VNVRCDGCKWSYYKCGQWLSKDEPYPWEREKPAYPWTLSKEHAEAFCRWCEEMMKPYKEADERPYYSEDCDECIHQTGGPGQRWCRYAEEEPESLKCEHFKHKESDDEENL